MGIFDRSDSGQRDEVEVNISEEDLKETSIGSSASRDSNDSSKLKSEVESKVSSAGSTSTSSISVEDIHRQNERIIELLEKMVDEEDDEDEFTGGMNGVL